MLFEQASQALSLIHIFAVEDIIWTGPQPTLREMGAEVGIARTFPVSALRERIRKAIALGRRVHYLPPYRGETKLQLADLLGIRTGALHDHKSVDLMLAVAEMREIKSCLLYTSTASSSLSWPLSWRPSRCSTSTSTASSSRTTSCW